MYAEFFKLSGRPFQLTPDPRFYFESRTHRKAMAYLTYGISQGEGFIIITGDIGAGKTTLVGHVLDTLDQTKFLCASVVTTQIDADNTLRMVAQAFGLKAEGLDKATLLGRMENFLRKEASAGHRVILIVDEAQNLPIEALEELRMLSNFQEGDRALLQTFLLGQPEFRQKLAHSEQLEQLRQRVIATHHLEPMGVEEVGEYIHHRLRLVGWEQDPQFTEEAFERIHFYSGGVPRRLNTLCSRLLLYAAIEEIHIIEDGIVEEVIADLQLDNTPMTGPKHQLSEEEEKSHLGALPKSNGVQNGNHTGASGDIEIGALAARLDEIERKIEIQNATLKQTLGILTTWMEAEADEQSG